MGTEIKHSKKHIAFGAAAANLFSKIVSSLVPFLTAILVMRLLSVKDFGTFSLFLSFLSIFGGLSLGIHHVYQRYVAMYVEDKSDLPRVIRLTFVLTGMRLALFFGVLLIGYVLKLLNVFNPAQFNFPYLYLAVIVCVAVICKMMLQEGLISAYIDQKFYYLFDSSITVLKALFIFMIRPTTVAGFIYIWLFLELFRVGVLVGRFFYLIRKDSTKIEAPVLRNLEFRRYIDYGKYFFFASVSTQILAFDIDQYFLSYFRGNVDVGLYSFATKMSFFLVGFAPVNLLFNVTTPLIIKDYEKNRDTGKFRDIISTLFKFNLFVYSAIVLSFCFNVEFIIRTVFHGKYVESIPYILALAPISFFPVIKNTFEPVARGIEKSRVYLSGFIAALLNLLGNFLLIPEFGITGAIISTGFAMAVQSIAFVMFARREISFRFDVVFLVRMLINSALLFAAGLVLYPYSVASLPRVIAANLLLLGAFFLLYRINRCFNDDEAAYLNSFLPRKVFVF